MSESLRESLKESQENTHTIHTQSRSTRKLLLKLKFKSLRFVPDGKGEPDRPTKVGDVTLTRLLLLRCFACNAEDALEQEEEDGGGRIMI